MNLNSHEDYESITRAEVNALAARLLDFDKGWLFKASKPCRGNRAFSFYGA